MKTNFIIKRLTIAPFFLTASFLYSTGLYIFPTDKVFDYEFNLPTSTYHAYCKNFYSQNGEDGILQQILKELGIENGTFL